MSSEKILPRINSPQDLKQLSLDELKQLASEIRATIIETVARNGGHLASNLGAVELTLALHYVFESPRDKIIWDVGHQCYTHKLVTGRREAFSRLRQSGGLLGYPCREESEHDIYNTGHASTALSAALGLAVARDKKNEDYNVIAVVGDGSLTGGVAYEALNQIGHLRKKLIIVLNYNEMSISPSVGALSSYLSYMVSGQPFLKMKEQAKSVLRSIPKIGRPLIKAARAFEELLKKTFFPGIFFEELGIRYVGPIHGHSLHSLLEAFENARNYPGPVLVHCVTQKGKGYRPAQLDPEKFHSASPFNVETGQPLCQDNGPTFSRVFGEAIADLGRSDDSIMAITAAMTDGTGLNKFAAEHPDRFFDVGIAEQHAVNFAAGLAIAGLKPVVAIYSTFLQRAYDQIFHDVCLMDLPVVFALDRAGIVAEDGPTHQGINDIAYLRHMPHMILMAPKDENELRQMIYSAFQYGHPVAIRFPKGKGFGVRIESDFNFIPAGQAELLKPGRDLIIAYGNMVYTALEVARRLEEKGLSLAVINARFARPLDENLIIEQARQARTIFTLEEGIIEGGFGSAVRELLDRHGLYQARFKSFGLPTALYPLGKPDEIRKLLRLDVDSLVEDISRFYSG
ncbi:MAG TPA: 1-deoxy-D-xylulose-5-phosphate synthase [Candidatus Saccharicenans sp.]|nr:1-deoxy-D-xylulose-5-phosphate synthase [Candidatus Saccharicenans sp.]HOL45306.1 1-deoxy-D-xylulose-5-phosphate synthase [Candidatus Saccharicenans sp.]HOM94028.1 1-deoxy-D-xylulose-5-phosphate synthase [Candidatus Saccharicenans sp.]HOT69079.1 1-deoxy-D-xylulose-5-phosphate synthase [Candidatus Saccharicenans sp.]HPP23709.1 1-deoxy-D-xylulose-5-phosphate synthase [Candidatus Saccharicenans sp.]